MWLWHRVICVDRSQRPMVQRSSSLLRGSIREVARKSQCLAVSAGLLSELRPLNDCNATCRFDAPPSLILIVVKDRQRAAA